MGDVTTSGGSTTPANPNVQPTVDMLLKGLQGAYQGGYKPYDKSLYTDPSSTTKNGWRQGAQFGKDMIVGGGFSPEQQQAMGQYGGLFSGYGSADDGTNRNLSTIGRGYRDMGDNNGLTSAQGDAMSGTQGLGAKYGALGDAYDPNSEAYQTLRQDVTDDTLSSVNSMFGGSGRLGSGLNYSSASKGLGSALAGLDYGNMQNDINNQYRSLDSQRGIFGDVFGMGQTGVGNQFGALAGQTGIESSIFGNKMATLGGQSGIADRLFSGGQQGVNNRSNAIGTIAGVGAAQDADASARRAGAADWWDRNKNANWNTLGRASSILGGTAPSGGQQTSNSVPWWAAMLGGGATAASIFG